MREIPQCAFDLVSAEEQKVLFAYDDAHWPPVAAKPGDVIHGTLTGGYGHTGKDVVVGMTVTDALAESWLSDDLHDAAFKLRAKIGDEIVNDLTEHQYAALLSFVLNVGTGNPAAPEWTIWKRLRAKQYDQVPLELGKFVNGHVDGKLVKIKGLVNRRAAEVQEWSTNEPGSVSTIRPSADMEVVPTPAEPKPPSRSGVVIAGAAGAVASAAPMVDQARQAIAPYAIGSETIRHVLGTLAVIGACLAVASLVLAWLDRRRAHN